MSRRPDKPTERDLKDEEAFLSRWSRMKADESTKEAAVTSGAKTGAPEEAGGAEDRQLTEEEIVASLPDIEGLEKTSDFTPFLRQGVPELLKRQALRRLWRINPVFAEIDGLAEYAEDYTDAASTLTEIKTAYKVGRGYLDEEAEDDKEESPEAASRSEPELGEEALPEKGLVVEANDAPQAERAAGPQMSDKSADPMPRGSLETKSAVALDLRATKGRAAARRWGLPES